MVVEECLPRLRWWSTSVHHVFAHAGFANVDPEFQQFAMNLRSPPKWTFAAYVWISSRTSFGTLGRPGLPCLIFHVQNNRNPLRCRPMTVDACMMNALAFKSCHTVASHTQKEAISRREFRTLHGTFAVYENHNSPAISGCSFAEGIHAVAQGPRNKNENCRISSLILEFAGDRGGRSEPLLGAQPWHPRSKTME